MKYQELFYKHQWNTRNYYVNNNEIPGNLSRENFISSHVEITCYRHMWVDHRCYGNTMIRVRSRAFVKVDTILECYLYNWYLYNNQNITWSLGDTKFLFSCWKIFISFAALTLE